MHTCIQTAGLNDPQDPAAGWSDLAATTPATKACLCFSKLITSLDLSQLLKLGIDVCVCVRMCVLPARFEHERVEAKAQVPKPAPWFRMHGQAPLPADGAQPTSKLLNLNIG